MSEKEHHRVHFGEEADTFGKDNEIVVQKPDDGKYTAHLGFLQVGHRYSILVTLPKNLCQISESPEWREANKSQNVPNVNCKFLSVSKGDTGVILKLELFAYKEKLLKEELCLECSDSTLLTLTLMARVLGRGKGTPLLRNGIKCIGVELEDESEASDWQGFD
ncbi:adipose-secreted signaling protein [Periplaneta americana]|uniref:adipose-secreted signaling protein n=1 Tax=Periplaneta americana TaxID=6978 RepID=UPI0037E7A6BC